MPIGRSECLRKHLDRFTRPLPGVEKGDVRALHRARVATRRLRELLPVLQMDRDTGKRLERRLRRVTKRLGTVRELDVLLLLIDELHVSRRHHPQALSRVAVTVSKERDDARKRLFDRLPLADMWRAARKLERAAAELDKADQTRGRTSAARSWRWAIDARVARRAARLSAAIHETGAVYLPERLHSVRIALKKLRYAVELSAEVAGQPIAELRMLKRGQDVLGRLHDVQVLIDRVRQVQASLTPPSITVWRALGVLVTALDDDCRRLHARYMRVRPDLETIAARLGLRAPVSNPRARRAAG